MNINDLSEYTTNLDEVDKRMVDNKVAEVGIDKFLSQQLIYLDCSRIINNMRMMQTIGYPYQREITSYLYALDKAVWLDGYQDKHKEEWTNKLLEQHYANLEYEKENPPIWYGGKKAKDKWLKDNKATKLPRRRKLKESTIPGFDKDNKAAITLKAKTIGCIGLKFNLNPAKKD